ncbi:MAG: cell division protein ZapA [Candidatus Marinimicrobia bacterium]|nr:cell division protein ZapA [Candidatus Neomarinimicrobiota bacterium]|tara:strand:+ start:701 stop:1003 length:303 start_codon:yes stop_codon:yes gene_type:complete
MVEDQDNLARVSIFGHEYTVKAQAEADYIADVAQFVDQKMREVEKELPSSQSTARIAILAAMSITDDYFAEKRQRNNVINEVEEKASSLIDLLDENLAPV